MNESAGTGKCLSCRMIFMAHSLNYCEDAGRCACLCGEDDGSPMYATIPSVDAEIRTLTASRDRLADALRELLEAVWGSDEPPPEVGGPWGSVTSSVEYETVARAAAALTDIPDCPHAQRVEALEKAIRAIDLSDEYVLNAADDDELIIVRRPKSVWLTVHAALTASTGEA